jgi:DNA-binding CsgD family transcriptional regulator
VGVIYLDAAGLVAQVENAGAARSQSETSPAVSGEILRHATDRMREIKHLGFAPALDLVAPDLEGAPDSPCLIAMLRDLEPSSPLATVISPLGDDPAVCIAPLGNRDRQRCLFALIAGDSWDDGAFRIVGATFPMLAKRATRVLVQSLEGQTPWLTDREQLILVMISEGYSVRDIAEAIDRSPYTVNDHFKALHKKLGTSTRGELMARAFGQPGVFTT